MTGHTPGPWEVSPPEAPKHQWNITAGRKYDSSQGAKRRIAFVGNTQPVSLLPDVEANAHLIAAAPDLFEALEEFVLARLTSRVIAPAKGLVALAKARGEIPEPPKETS